MKAAPPFEITPEVVSFTARIERLLGQVETTAATRPEPRLRKQNRIRTIKDSLAIEGNTLSLEQVTAIFENKRVFGTKREILEVQNAIKAYETSPKWHSANESDFKKAHGILMKGLVAHPGKYRSGSVGVLKGTKVSHLAPPHLRVPALMSDLFKFIGDKKSKLSPLILSAVAHYEIEFIHPFDDGNGRIGRLWQHVILQEYHQAFQVVPFESLIKENQADYYRILEKCDKAGDSTEFVVFSLSLLVTSLEMLLTHSPRRRLTANERLMLAESEFKTRWFTRREYLRLFPNASAPTASRDLAHATEQRKLVKRGKLNKTEYKFKG